MAILSVTNVIPGLAGVFPNIVFINTNDSSATITTAGYLTAAVRNGTLEIQPGIGTSGTSTMCLVNEVNLGVNSAAWYTVVTTGTPGAYSYSLSTPAQAPGIFLGNIQAGQNGGPAGGFISFPAAINTGHLFLAATANAGNFTTTITNAALGQATVFTIPDPGVAATYFLLGDSAGGQTIRTGSLTVALSNISAGSAGHAGGFISAPPTAVNGSLILAAANAGAAFNTTISNGTMGQSTVYTIPDAGNAAGRFLVAATATPFTANHSLVASGTGGLIADAGYQQKVVAQAAVAGGAAAQTIVDAFCTAGSTVIGNWNDTTNAVTVQKVAAGNGSFVVTSSADPGASHFSYTIYKV
jgi:hypothetical protein